MGCKCCKVSSQSNGEVTSRIATHESVDTENPPPNDSDNLQHELLTNVKDGIVSGPHTIVAELVDMKFADPRAFHHLFIQQRQQAIDNHIYRSTITSWKPHSLGLLAEVIKTSSKEKSTVDRHWMIFYWIACNIVYDAISYFSKDHKDQSAEGVFRTRKGVCAGYANLYKYLCDQLQMPCEVVSGHSKGYAFDDREGAPSDTNHVWNAVEIDGHWYLIDSTWGTGHLDEKQKFCRELTPYYFLVRPNEMIYHHLPENDKWQLLQTPIRIAQFMKIPKAHPTYFELHLELVSPRNQAHVDLLSGKPYALVLIRAPSGVDLSAVLKLKDEKIDGGHRVVFDNQKQLYCCYFAPSTIGKHRITIYAKRGEATIGTYHPAVDLALDIRVPPENPISYPKTWKLFFHFGLKILSPLRTHIVNLKEGERFAQIVIRTPSDIQLIGELREQNDQIVLCGDRVYYDRQKDFWRCKFAPNGNGMFEAVILAKKTNDPNAYASVVSFQIAAHRLSLPALSFPKTWQLFNDLNLRILYPASRGIILLNDKFRFAEIRIRTPNDVHLIGQLRNDRNEELNGGEQVYYDNEKSFWRCRFTPNKIGIFDAIILAKKTSDPGNFTSVVLFKIELKELLTRPACFLNTNQLFHDLRLEVVSPLGPQKIVLSQKASYAEILLKTPNDVSLRGQLLNSNKERISDGNQVYYDRHKDLWCCKFTPNQNGLFNAVILARKKSDTGSYSVVVTFQIEANYIPKPPVDDRKHVYVNENSIKPVRDDAHVTIQVADPEAFHSSIDRKRQQAIDNVAYRSTIKSWTPNSLQHLAETIRSFSKGKSAIDRHWMIFYWIACNIAYDTVSYFSKDYKDQSAEAVFRTRKGVCAGYANLYKYLSEQLQMSCEVVGGYSKGYGFDDREEAPSETDHAWNAVEIDGHWYLMESTWGAGHMSKQKTFERELNAYYFLPHPNEMIYHHLPENDKWQLLQTPISMTQYMQMPKVHPTYFELNLELVNPCNQARVDLLPDKPYALVLIRAPSDVGLSATLKLKDEKIDGGHRVAFDSQKQLYCCYFAPSAIGEHRITIFGKRHDSERNVYHEAVDLTFDVQQRPTHAMSFPETWENFFAFGLDVISPRHTHLIKLNQGTDHAEIQIKAPKHVELLGRLKNEQDEKIVSGDRVYYDRRNDIWRCQFAPDRDGHFVALILAKEKSNPGSYTSAVSFKIEAKHIPSPPLSYPNSWQLFHDLNLKVVAPQNCSTVPWLEHTSYVEVLIRAPNDVQLSCDIRYKDVVIENGSLAQFDAEKMLWQLLFAPQCIGEHDLFVFAKRNDEKTAGSALKFHLNVTQLRRSTKFPTIYGKFYAKKCRIYEPLDGVLKKGATVPIHCVIPGASEVNLVVDSNWLKTDGYQDPILKRNIIVGSEAVTIYAKYGQSTSYEGLVQYSVR